MRGECGKGTEKVRARVVRKAKVVSEKHTSEQAWKEMAREVVQREKLETIP